MDITRIYRHFKVRNIAVIHCLFFPHFRQRILTDLTVISPTVIMIRCSLQYNAHRRMYPHCLIIFSIIGHKLTGQKRLCHMTEHFRVNIFTLPLFIFHDIICRFQAVGKMTDKILLRNMEIICFVHRSNVFICNCCPDLDQPCRRRCIFFQKFTEGLIRLPHGDTRQLQRICDLLL